MEKFSFEMPKSRSSAIKVIGVGGGGNNALNYMYAQGITGVDFVICNTDAQALHNSPIPNKIQLGVSITEGLGAGANPDIGEQAAVESIEDIKTLFGSHTKMAFITAGMGGGTGTGAAPIIASVAKELGILTVGIVTVPFFFEGKSRLEQAEKGVEKLRNNVDTLIVINNDKLRELYGNLGFKTGFAKADEVLTTAAKGIAEVITQNYTINIDLRDAKTVLAESGTAIMGSAKANGADKAKEAIRAALDSPLLNDNKISGAKNVLLLIKFGTEEITIDEIGIINEYIQNEAGNGANIIMGVGEDLELGEDISVTVVATGFPVEDQRYTGREEKKIIHTLRDEIVQTPTRNYFPDKKFEEKPTFINDEPQIKRFVLEDEETDKSNLKDTSATENDLEMKLIVKEISQIEVLEEPKNGTDFQVEELKDDKIVDNEPIIFQLEDFEQEPTKSNAITLDLFSKEAEIAKPETPQLEKKEVKTFEKRVEEMPINDELQRKIEERRNRLKQFNAKYNHLNNLAVDDMEKTPAFQRQGINLDEVNKNQSPKFYLDTENDEVKIRPNNFLHDNVD